MISAKIWHRSLAYASSCRHSSLNDQSGIKPCFLGGRVSFFLSVFRKGYMLHDRLLRAAQVTVSKKSEPETTPGRESEAETVISQESEASAQQDDSAAAKTGETPGQTKSRYTKDGTRISVRSIPEKNGGNSEDVTKISDTTDPDTPERR